MASAALQARTCGLPVSAATAAAAAAAALAMAAAVASSAGGMGSKGPGGPAVAACPPASVELSAVLGSVAMPSAEPAAAANGETTAGSCPSAAPSSAVACVPPSPVPSAPSASTAAAADCPVAPLARLLKPSAAARLLAVENQMEGASGSTCTAARSREPSCNDQHDVVALGAFLTTATYGAAAPACALWA